MCAVFVVCAYAYEEILFLEWRSEKNVQGEHECKREET